LNSTLAQSREEIKEWLKEKSHRELMHEFYSKNLKTRRAPSFYEKEALVIAKQVK
jgi:hypothetical protein